MTKNYKEERKCMKIRRNYINLELKVNKHSYKKEV
jgi:hypothetical protein